MMDAMQYRESLKKMHTKVYYMGKQIENIVEDPMTSPHVNSAAMTYALAQDPVYEDLMTAKSHLTGKKINRFTHIHQSKEDLVKKVKMLRMIAQNTGTCFQRCVGFDAMNATYITTFAVDHARGTSYHARFQKWLQYVQENDLMVAGAMTDVKGDRSRKPSGQQDADLFTYVVEKREDGIVICGAKAHMTGIVNSHEMLILPTSALSENDQDYVARFAAFHRQNYGACKVGNADILIGASALMADMNGAAGASHIKDKLIEMVHLAETMYCCSLACSWEGQETPCGSYFVDPLLANEVKLNVTKNILLQTRNTARWTGSGSPGSSKTCPVELPSSSPCTAPALHRQCGL